MNLYWEKDESLTSRTHVLRKGGVTAVASNIIRPRQGILEATKIHYGYKDMDMCVRPNARVKPSPIYLYKCVNREKAHGRESAVGRLHSRQNSSTRVISDRPPSQPRRCRRMSRDPSSVSAKKSHKDPDVGEDHRRGSRVLERLQQSDSKWDSGSGALTDRPPLKPFIRHPRLEEPRLENWRLQQSDDSRWSSGYRATFDITPFQALAGSVMRRLQQIDDSSWSSGYRTP